MKRVINRLHDRIGILVSCAAALILLLSGLWWGYTTREAIHEEVEAAARVADQWLGVLARDAEYRDDTAQLNAQLAAVGRIRANLLEVHDSAGKLKYRSPASTYKAGRDAPQWFSRLLMPHFEPRTRNAGDLRLTLHPDASRATLDAWDHLLQVGGWALALLVLLGLVVRHAINRTLAPLSALEAALERSADGRFDVRLPSHGIAELDRLALRYNRMADELAQSLQQNARLEQDQAFAQALQARLEDERRQIARELHDEVAQSVTAVRAMAGAIAQRSEEQPNVHGSAQAILAMTSQMQDGVHAILQRLRRPEPVAAGRLAAALRQYCSHWAGLYPNIELHQQIEDEPHALREDFCLTVLRLLQESLTNVARHAGASRVDVTVRCHADALTLDVGDDGCGFAPAHASDRHGLVGMRERVSSCAGSLELRRNALGGAQVTARLPLASTLQAAQITAAAGSHDADGNNGESP